MARRSASTIWALRSKSGPLSSDRNAPVTDVSPVSMNRPVLEIARRRERPEAYGDVEAREHRFEVIERDVVQRDLGQHGRMGLGQEVGVTVQIQLAVIEHDGAHLQR